MKPVKIDYPRFPICKEPGDVSVSVTSFPDTYRTEVTIHLPNAWGDEVHVTKMFDTEQEAIDFLEQPADEVLKQMNISSGN